MHLSSYDKLITRKQCVRCLPQYSTLYWHRFPCTFCTMQHRGQHEMGILIYATIRLSITSEHLRLIRAITLWGCKPCKGIAWITEISMGFYVKYSRTILYRMALLQESVLKGLRISGISSYFNPHTRSNALFMEPIENLLQNYDCHPLMLVIEICTS